MIDQRCKLLPTRAVSLKLPQIAVHFVGGQRISLERGIPPGQVFGRVISQFGRRDPDLGGDERSMIRLGRELFCAILVIGMVTEPSSENEYNWSETFDPDHNSVNFLLP